MLDKERARMNERDDLPDEEELRARQAKRPDPPWPEALTERDQDEPGMTTSQPEGVGRIPEDARGPKAQPARPRSVSASEKSAGVKIHVPDRSPDDEPSWGRVKL